MKNQDSVIDIQFVLLNLGLQVVYQAEIEYESLKDFVDMEKVRLVLIDLLQDGHLQIAGSSDQKRWGNYSVSWQVKHCTYWYNLGTYELSLYLTNSGARVLENLKNVIESERQIYLSKLNEQRVYDADREIARKLKTFYPIEFKSKSN